MTSDQCQTSIHFLRFPRFPSGSASKIHKRLLAADLRQSTCSTSLQKSEKGSASRRQLGAAIPTPPYPSQFDVGLVSRRPPFPSHASLISPREALAINRNRGRAKNLCSSERARLSPKIKKGKHRRSHHSPLTASNTTPSRTDRNERT